MWNIEQIAKLARMQRIISKQRRKEGDEQIARITDKAARHYEETIRDYATEIELGKGRS